MNLYCLKFNNIHNRKIQRLETLSDYVPYLVGDVVSGVINFTPGDGVYTSQVLTNWTSDTPDYVVVADDNSNIVSRWFVAEADYIMVTQLRLSLKRDTVADFLDETLDAVAYIRKGFVNNNSPLIFNNENVSFNQIKKGEYPLKNQLGAPWLVAYLARKDSAGNFLTYRGEAQGGKLNVAGTYASMDAFKANYKYGSLVGTTFTFTSTARTRAKYSFRYKVRTDTYAYSTYDYFFNGLTQNETLVSKTGTTAYPLVGTGVQLNQHVTLSQENRNTWWSAISEVASSATTAGNYNSYWQAYTGDVYNSLSGDNGKVYYIGNKYYKLNVTATDFTTKTVLINNGSGVGTIMKNGMASYTDLTLNSETAYLFNVSFTASTVTATLEEVNYEFTYTYEFAYGTPITADAPYEIVGIPYFDGNITVNGKTYAYTKEGSMAFMTSLINNYTLSESSYLYDAQVVPYAPYDGATLTVDTTKLISVQDKFLAFMFDKASFSVNCVFDDIPIDQDNKVSNECDLYRFVGQNGMGGFDFSPAKNGGLQSVEADVTLLPHNPYIKINPLFGNLYGSDFNDYRGLICQGDFGLPLLTSAWNSYQLNNKNYQAVFDRQIDTMEFNNKFGLVSDIVNATVGVGSGAITGALAGGKGTGGIVGGVIGGLASLGGGIADVAMNQAQRQRQIEDAKAYHEYELGNIKARATTLTRSTSININNKYFPYIEYYTCTDEEKAIFTDILKYQGMTVKAIGKPSDYINPSAEFTFIQGDIIDIDVTEDGHVADDINQQLNGGIRIYG